MANRDRLLITLAAFLAVLPLILHGCSCGHDFDFHLLSWQEAAQQFAHGNLHPRWAFTPAWGAGEPRFVFYPPLSWTIGALLTLAAAGLAALTHLNPAQIFAATPIAYTWLALTLAGLAMHHLAGRFVSPTPALLVAILYLANPYTLFTAYERTAFAELLAAAWLPLLLAALLPTRRDTRLSIHRTAIPLALLWLTNAPAAVIGSYALALIVALRLIPLLRRVPPTSPRLGEPAVRHSSSAARPAALILAARAIAATALALALAAFYIVPAVLERPWVLIHMAILPGLRPEDNTLFHHTTDAVHDAVLLSASHLALILLAITSVALILQILRGRRHPIDPLGPRLNHSPGYIRLSGIDTGAPAPFPAPPLPPVLPILIALTATIAFLLTPLSLPLWHHLPELAFLQFPWRLLALLAPICAFSLALLFPVPPSELSSRPKAARSDAAEERPASAPAQSPGPPSTPHSHHNPTETLTSPRFPGAPFMAQSHRDMSGNEDSPGAPFRSQSHRDMSGNEDTPGAPFRAQSHRDMSGNVNSPGAPFTAQSHPDMSGNEDTPGAPFTAQSHPDMSGNVNTPGAPSTAQSHRDMSGNVNTPGAPSTAQSHPDMSGNVNTPGAPSTAQSHRDMSGNVLSPRPPLTALLLAAALILPAYAAFHQPCDDEDTPQARYALLRTPTGDEPTDEYTPTTADNDTLKDNNPGYRLLPQAAGDGTQPANDDTPPPPDANPGPAPLTLDLNLPSPALLILNLRDYPTWQVIRNGALDPDRIRRADGLLTLDLPAGPEHLRITQRTPPPELAADALSALALLLTIALSRRRKRTIAI